MTAKELNIIDNNEYQQWLQQLCTEIDKQRLKAAMQLNAATLQHYWWLGNDIIRQQKEQGWGAKVIDQLSIFLFYSLSSNPISPTKRTAIAHHYFDVDASQILWIVKNEISPLKKAICFFIKELNK